MAAGLFLQPLAGVPAAFAQSTQARQPSAPDAKLFFVEPAEGATVGTTFKVKFGITGMAVSPAGKPGPNTGHHHLIIDTDLPPFDERIPSDFNHIHFGGGQTETEVTLPPGDHTLQLLFADHDHVPHNPPVFSKELRIKVVDKGAAPPPTAQQGPGGATTTTSGPGSEPSQRKPSPPDAQVYFVNVRNGSVIPRKFTVKFGLTNMGVAPAGVDKPNTGHHHLLIDTDLPPLDAPIPNDFNHVHFGKGQTEKTIDLKLGTHTLQLILADDRHVPHDPPVVSQKIRVSVKILKPKKPKPRVAAVGRQP
jgi:hypothetical protein